MIYDLVAQDSGTIPLHKKLWKSETPALLLVSKQLREEYEVAHEKNAWPTILYCFLKGQRGVNFHVEETLSLANRYVLPDRQDSSPSLPLLRIFLVMVDSKGRIWRCSSRSSLLLTIAKAALTTLI